MYVVWANKESLGKGLDTLLWISCFLVTYWKYNLEFYQETGSCQESSASSVPSVLLASH